MSIQMRLRSQAYCRRRSFTVLTTTGRSRIYYQLPGVVHRRYRSVTSRISAVYSALDADCWKCYVPIQPWTCWLLRKISTSQHMNIERLTLKAAMAEPFKTRGGSDRLCSTDASVYPAAATNAKISFTFADKPIVSEAVNSKPVLQEWGRLLIT